jgi:putative membrane protein
MISHRRYLAILGMLYAALWIPLAIHPRDRQTWALENILVVFLVVALGASHRVFLLSRLSYTLVFILMCVHAVGAHYTYAQVPYDAWFKALTGWSLNEAMGWQRNHFDRFTHFLYGLLMAYPLREFFLRIADARGFWGYFLPLDVAISTSAIFELFEWLAAEIVGGDVGAAYLGTQGDIWDAQRDMALASLGALIAMLVTALVNAYLRRDFARELQQSLRVKSNVPLGEDEIARLTRSRR